MLLYGSLFACCTVQNMASLHHACVLPWLQDGHPIIGAMPGVDGLYAAIMHSGMTLAPHVGQLVAAEVSHGQMQQAWLGPYRPGRDMQQGQGQAAYAWKGKASVHGSKP